MKEMYVTPEVEVYSLMLEQTLLESSLDGGGTGEDLLDPGSLVIPW